MPLSKETVVRCVVVCLAMTSVFACTRTDEETKPAEPERTVDDSQRQRDGAAAGLPADIAPFFEKLGDEFDTDGFPEGFGGCLVEPMGVHRSFVCADSEAVVENDQRADHFAVFVEVDGAVKSIIASTAATEDELVAAFAGCTPNRTVAPFFDAEESTFYNCSGYDVSFGTPRRALLSRGKRAIVLRVPGFELGEQVDRELGGEPVRIGGVIYTLDTHELSAEVPLLTGETREAPEGQQFLTLYYTLKSDLNQRTSLSHDRVQLLDGGGKAFQPIAAARDNRTAGEDGGPNGVMMMFDPGDERRLKDVFLIPSGITTDGFGVRFRGAQNRTVDRYVMGERRWIEIGETEGVAAAVPTAPDDDEQSPQKTEE